MQIRKAKFIIIILVILFLFFFSNDFGLIDVEKTSIITAIAIDKEENGNFNLTAQIAVPEATDTNTENQKSQLSGTGSTVGAALNDIGDLSGWFPKLAFCNLILIGNSLSQDNVITALDYFAKTLRVQDSALVAIAENTAKELLDLATPLDNISSFALQKIMLKTSGFDRDVAPSDVKTFCADHYSIGQSSYMPLIKVISAGGEKSSSGQGGQSNLTGGTTGSGGSSQQDSKDNLFSAKTTALFVKGKKVGELDEPLTIAFNALKANMAGTTLSIDNVKSSSGQPSNYLLTVVKSTPKMKLIATDTSLTLNIDIKVYCKISDHAADGSDEALSQNKPLPEEVISATKTMLEDDLNELIITTRQTECDFLKIKEKLYRHNYRQYSIYKDNYLKVFKPQINVTVLGQV